MTSALVIGGGVIGASCAYQLARAGARVTVLDRAAGPAEGSTGRATGGFRAQYATAINVRLSLLARRLLATFEAETGVDPDFAPVGYLWLATTAANLAELRTAHAVQRAEGLHEAAIVTPAEIHARNPHAELTGVVGGAWCPSDGVIRPREILRGYLAAAARAGATIHWSTAPEAFERTGDHITAVRTADATFTADVIINAAGAWAAPLAALAGVAIPITPLRRQVAITAPTTLPETLPMTIWDDGFHLRVRDGRVLLLKPTPGDPADAYNDRVEPAWLDMIAALAPARIPALRGVAIDREASWAGLYEMSPDHHALLGFAPGCANLLLVNGSSGHGVMHAPALGLLAAELATARPPSLDVHALRPERFAEGDPIRGSALL